MSTTSTLIRLDLLRSALPIAFAIGALALMSARAQAEDIGSITISAPVVKNLGIDFATGEPVEQVTVTARVKADPTTLTTKSGVANLERRVREAAREACEAADPRTPDYDGICFRNAVRSAQQQVSAAVALATSNPTHTVSG